MYNWFSRNLGDAMLAGTALEQLKEQFAARYANSGHESDAAIFMRHESEGRLHCEVKVYFSPATADLAKACAATPCGKPFADGLGLLAGSEASWPRLFPGHGD